jgi:hypothetical protein
LDYKYCIFVITFKEEFIMIGRVQGISRLFVMFFATGLFLLGSVQDAAAAANINFKATAVNLQNGKEIIEGNLINDGDAAGTVEDVKIHLVARDRDGNLLIDDSSVFGGILVYVASGAVVPHRFIFNNPGCSGYDGVIRWSVDADLTWDNWNS